MDQYQKLIAAKHYARWLPEEGRRETWTETVDRYIGFWQGRVDLDTDETIELRNAIKHLEVMPSMRCLMTAGPALERDNVAGFNCSYMPIDSPRAFDELMYILMCGTGVGFSVERQYIQKLPEVPDEFIDGREEEAIVVPDSKIGWADSLRSVIRSLYSGVTPRWDLSKIRGKGSPLATFGGRASGPAPLADLFQFTTELFNGAAGRKLSSLECHDLCCKIAQVIVVGGVRRSALISLSNPSDARLRTAKTGYFPSQRYLANNSGAYTERPELDFFLNEWTALYESKSGERGIFSRTASQEVAARNGRRNPDQEFGTNPCSEIILRPNQFCNLSEVVVRNTDTLAQLKEKVRKATILGTMQATLTDFRYLRKCWKDNTEEEALLGVSLTGIQDHEVLGSTGTRSARWLKEMREVAVETNRVWAERLGIKQSAAITCVKPSGTVSQLCDTASGIHPRYSDYYIRRIRADKTDPLAEYMVEAGFPHETDVHNEEAYVFEFPKKAPEGATVEGVRDAISQLELWSHYQEHWCEHKPSITVSYTPDEFIKVGQWVWDNFDKLSGVSFLPYDGHVYQQAPYEKISGIEYEKLLRELPEYDPQDAATFEAAKGDTTEGSQELACHGGACEL